MIFSGSDQYRDVSADGIFETTNEEKYSAPVWYNSVQGKDIRHR